MQSIARTSLSKLSHILTNVFPSCSIIITAEFYKTKNTPANGIRNQIKIIEIGCRCLPPSLLRDTLSCRIVGRDRLLWNSMVQGTQGFRQVRVVRCVIPYVLCGCLYCLRCWCLLRWSLSALIYPWGQGYMESPSRAHLESYYNTVG